ncbi:WWE protein-protein interaction domain protein family [Striga asiatica]|uniref:WWE protein-protein interaction domain protein family n=1 Tax=Striga asiatica TaxID=4170 RepID=A0A5A7RHX9_STRAF|nr:WWE protein-protein interaction domain protein family [Striga asiatica]
MNNNKQLTNVPSQSLSSTDAYFKVNPSSDQSQTSQSTNSTDANSEVNPSPEQNQPSNVVTLVTSSPIPNDEPKYWLSNGFVRVPTTDWVYNTINARLVSSLRANRVHARTESIYKHDYCSSVRSRVRFECFHVCFVATERMRRGGPNIIKYGWYGASKSEINMILAHGFGLPTSNINRVSPRGVYFNSLDRAINGLESSIADEEGVKHMLLCRLLMGNMEVVNPFSGQENPSFEAFDNGVDDLTHPKKYLVWHTKMNTHVLPDFVVSFRTSPCTGACLRVLQPVRSWIPIPTLINALSSALPRDKLKLVIERYKDYRTRKIMRHEMVQTLRSVAGDRLLQAILKSYEKAV